MNYTEFENKLKKRTKQRKLKEWILFVAFLALTIVGASLLKNVVSAHQDAPTYPLIMCMLIGILGFISYGVLLLFEYICTKVTSIDLGSCVLTYYKTALFCEFYIDGELKERLGIMSKPYAELPLSDGAKLTATVCKWHTHLSFSDGRQSVDI